MADESDSGEKTESPSARRLSQSRSEGMVGQSRDLSQVISITAAFIALQYIAPQLWRDLGVITTGSFTSRYSSEDITLSVIQSQGMALTKQLLPEVGLLVLIAALFGAGCTAVQTDFLWSWKLLRPKFSMINPLAGLKRLVSIQNLVSLLKSIAKLLIIMPVAYFAFLDLFPELVDLIDIPITDLLPFTADASSRIFWRVIAWLLVLAIIDLIWQKWHNYQQLKMSKWEVKEERKAVEGDDRVKRRILAIGLQRARQRMMEAVKTADVVVTNPTHISVALKYTMQRGSAPKVVAKGKGYVALRIREIAKDHRVPIVERKPLARALYKAVEVGHEIPFEFYRAVAELLAYVYKLRNRNPFRARPDASA